MKFQYYLGSAVLLTAFQVQAADFSRWGMSVSSEDNVTRAAWDADKRSDDIVRLDYLSGRYTVGDNDSRYALSYHTSYEQYLTYQGLNQLGVDGRASYRYKFGLGYQAWWWRAGIEAGYHAFGDSDRSSVRLAADLRLGKRFFERLNTQLFYRYLNEDASAAVFDHSGTELGLRLNYSVTRSWLLYASAVQYQGDITVSQSWAPPSTNIKATAVDSVFGLNAYLVDVNTAITRYGVNYAIDSSSSLDLSMERWAAQGVQNTGYWYYKNILKLSFNKVL